MKNKRKFPKDVASSLTRRNQAKRMSERSCIPVYNAGGTARKIIDNLGRVTYK